MKFDFVIGNPPYQLSKEKTENQTQGNSSWIYQNFQFVADVISDCSCLIYPFGGWFDTPTRLNKLGEKILTDKHTYLIHAYEGTSDKRAWYRNDRNPNPIFGEDANLSAGVSIVIRNKKRTYEDIRFKNRVYSDDEVFIKADNLDMLTPNPRFMKINQKLGEDKLEAHIKKGIFGIESDFVEKNPDLVSYNKADWANPVQLLTNDKSGSSGRATMFWTDKKNIPQGHEYIDLFKVITTSAYPKQKFSSGTPTVENVKERSKKIVELLPRNSAFGRSRMLLFASKNEQDCLNFLKYTQTNFFAGIILQEPNRRTAIGFLLPWLAFSDDGDIDWSRSVEEIDEQLYRKFNFTEEDIAFLMGGAE